MLIQRLIAHGHDKDKIPDYTIAQIELFTRAIADIDRRERANRLCDLATAIGAGMHGGEAATALGKIVDQLLKD